MGEAKKEYMKRYRTPYMREYRKRVSTVATGSLQSKSGSLHQDASKPALKPKQEKLAELRALIANTDALKSKSSPTEQESNSRIPRFNPLNPQIGEKVRMPSGEIVRVPELDMDGEPLTAVSSIVRLVSDNQFKPAFRPDIKPEKRKKGK